MNTLALEFSDSVTHQHRCRCTYNAALDPRTVIDGGLVTLLPYSQPQERTRSLTVRRIDADAVDLDRIYTPIITLEKDAMFVPMMSSMCTDFVA